VQMLELARGNRAGTIDGVEQHAVVKGRFESFSVRMQLTICALEHQPRMGFTEVFICSVFSSLCCWSESRIHTPSSFTYSRGLLPFGSVRVPASPSHAVLLRSFGVGRGDMIACIGVSLPPFLLQQ